MRFEPMKQAFFQLKHILLSNIYNRIEYKFYNLYEVFYVTVELFRQCANFYFIFLFFAQHKTSLTPPLFIVPSKEKLSGHVFVC